MIGSSAGPGGPGLRQQGSMRRLSTAALRWSARALDAILLVATFFAVARVVGQGTGAPGVSIASQLRLLAQILSVWLVCIHATGGYGDLRRVKPDVLFLRIGRAVLTALVVLTATQFVFPPEVPTSRAFLLGFAIASLLALFFLRLLHLPGAGSYDILVVGGAGEVRPFLDILERHRSWGFRVAGVVCPDHETLSPGEGILVLGTVSDLPKILRHSTITQVYMTGRAWDTRTLRSVADTCEQLGVTFSMDANFLGVSVERADLLDFDGWGMLSFSSTPRNADALLLKRLIDVTVSVIVLAVHAPLLCIVAALIRAEDGGPILFRQDRSGLYGRTFRMYKFRSMVVDAEARKASLHGLNEMSGPVFKMKDDPRVTRVGRWIRRLSLDEFPQFWNVLRGEMSLVGPRPPLPAEVESYERWQMRRLSMKPGITCIWQVSGRSNVDFDAWMRLDLEYIDNWGLFLDFWLLLRTIPVVVVGRGAR